MTAGSNHALLTAAGLLVLASLLLVASAGNGSAAAGPQTQDAADGRPAQEPASIASAQGPSTTADAPAPERRLVALDPAEHPSTPDSEWRLLPKSRGDALLELVWAPQYANSKRLLRSSTFNPRDQWLPVSCQRTVASTIAEMEATIKGLTAELTTTEDREFAALHARGLTTEVDFGLYEGAPQLAKIGADPVFKGLSGKTFGVSKTGMPDTRRAEGLLHDAGAGLVTRLADVFSAAGALTEEEREALTTRARAAVDPHGYRRMR